MTGLVSGLAVHIDSLLDVKHAVGLPYTTSERHLRAFDAMCAEQCPGQNTLTRALAMRWAQIRPEEHVNAQMRRITPVRQLAKHMTGLGLDAYVIPPGIPGGRVRYRPHLYSPPQLRAIFGAADRIAPSPYGAARHVIIPVIFRMMYCLGLRPGEARRLHRTDVDLAQGTVHIRESKGHKDRLVFLSAELHDYVRRYDAAISTHHPQRVSFFPNRDGDCYSASTLNHWFGQLLATAEPAIQTHPGSPARVYDLRHAHVVEVINTWTRAGHDPAALVIYLSLHLGHTNPEDTWYYFHLATDFHPDLRRLANTGIEALLTEPAHGI